MKHPVDFYGRYISVGDSIVRAVRHGSSAPNLEVCEVTKTASDGSIYLNGSKVPIQFPERLMVINEVRESL